MPVPNQYLSFWLAFARDAREAEDARFYEAFRFGDSEAMAHELAELVLRGVKHATASSLWSIEAEGKRLPQPGHLSTVTSWHDEPLCVIETKAVAVLPFRQVTPEFAACEGEGDKSLAYWQSAHRQCLSRECANAGRKFSDTMLVVCENFALVYPRRAGSVVAGR